MKTKQLLVSAFALTLVLTSCKKDDPEAPAPTPETVSYDNGVFITNEGPFGSGEIDPRDR